MARTVLTALFLIAVSVVPYAYVFNGQFLYDDYHVIYTNASLWRVHSFWDCLNFVLKPSKPVTNFFIALGHLFTAQAWGQRLLSLFFHSGVTLLFWSYLRRLKAPALIPALIFALFPIHSETIVVGLFRMDILGTFFTLIALHTMESICRSRKSYLWPVLFLALGAAQLSKEVFAVITPITLMIFYSRKLSRTFLWQIAGMESLWATVLLFLLKKDAASEYPYGDVIGVSILGWKTHLLLSARALVEGIHKTVFGYQLTTIRLADRLAVPHFSSIGLAAAILVSGAFAVARQKQTPWLLCAATAVAVYLLIPNINIGSEHYWYFPALGVAVLLASGLQRLEKFKILLASAYALSLLLALEHRLLTMKNRIEFHVSEAQSHPESAASWNNAAVALMETGSKDAYPIAKTFIDRAKTLAPNYPNVKVTEFLYHLGVSDKAAATRSLRELEAMFKNEPQKFSRYAEYFNLTYPHAGS